MIVQGTCSLCGEKGHKAKSRTGRVCCPKFATTPESLSTTRTRSRSQKRFDARFTRCPHNCQTSKTRTTTSHSACIACGTVFTRGQDATVLAGLCCLVDPRACPIAEHLGRRLPGDWCVWCGEDCLEGQSFCKKGCSVDYEQDVGCTFRNRPTRTIDVAVGLGDPWSQGRAS